MQAKNKSGQPFSDESKLRQRIAELEASVAKYRLELASLRQSNVCLQVLYDITRAGAEEQSVEAVARIAVDSFGRLVPCQRVRIALLDFQSQQTRVWTKDAVGKSWVGAETRYDLEALSGDSLKPLQMNESIPPLKHVNHGLGFKIIHALRARGICLCLSVPLVARGVSIGILNAWASCSAGFAPEQIDVIHETAAALAVVLDQASQREQAARPAPSLLPDAPRRDRNQALDTHAGTCKSAQAGPEHS